MKSNFMIYCLLLFCIGCAKNNNDTQIKLSYIANESNFFVPNIIPLKNEIEVTEFLGISKDLDYWKVFKINNSLLKQKNGKAKDQFTFVLSAKKDDDIIMIIDSDNDKDFSNNSKNIFKNLANVKRDRVFDALKSFKTVLYEIEGNNLKLNVFPYPEYYTTTEYKKINKLQIVISPYGYWFGKFSIDDKNYKIALKNYLSKTEILISKLKDSFQANNNYHLPYNLNEKIKLDNQFYFLDSANIKNNTLKISELNSKETIPTGIRNGFKFKNYQLKLLDDKIVSIDNIQKDKDYLIIDFWGTWCGPCIDLMPELEKIKRNNKNVQILGIALDQKKELVLDFIDEKKVDYPNLFVSYSEAEENPNNIINEQKITNYPYYILIDKRREILHRGYGQKSLEKIKSIINGH